MPGDTDPVIEIIDQHIPSLTAEDEITIDEMRANTMTDRFGQPEYEASDLALRTCHCGKKIDGFYEYVDHLKEMIRAAFE